MSKHWGGVLSIGVLLVVSGCVTREDIRGIQTGIYGIEQRIDERLGSVKKETENVQINQADLGLEMRDLNDNIAVLSSELQDSRQRSESLAIRLDDLEAALTARMDAQMELLSGSKFAGDPLPSTVFSLADTDYTRGRYPQALEGFRNYIKLFPKGERVPEAKLKIADALAKQKEYTKAITAYDELIENHPEHRLVSTALLRKGDAYEKMGDHSKAKNTYAKIIKDHAYKTEAALAKEKLQILQNP